MVIANPGERSRAPGAQARQIQARRRQQRRRHAGGEGVRACRRPTNGRTSGNSSAGQNSGAAPSARTASRSCRRSISRRKSIASEARTACSMGRPAGAVDSSTCLSTEEFCMNGAHQRTKTRSGATISNRGIPKSVRVIHKRCKGKKGARITISLPHARQKDTKDNLRDPSCAAQQCRDPRRSADGGIGRPWPGHRYQSHL